MSSDRGVALALEPGLRDIVEELEIYERLLVRWGRTINLVGNSTLSAIWTRHFMDSAQLAGFAPLAGSWVDLGSGAGFPGLVIALLQRFHSVGEMHLIESDVRKAAFLREVSRETGARAHVHNARCEDVLPSLQPAVITSRAMADIGRLVAYAQPFVEKGALGLFLKGRDVVAELTNSAIPSNFQVVLNPSKTDPRAAIVQVRAI